MARVIDASELEGDDLVNGYRRSPAEVDAQREAAGQGFYGNMLKGAVDQAGRQAEAAPRQRIEWHVAEPAAFEFFDDATWPDRPPIVLQQTLAR